MKPAKRKRLEKGGWKVGTVDEFLDLTPGETAYLELKISLGDPLRQHRLEQQLSQVELARIIRSSQSRIAKMETGDPGVSIDLLVKSLLALGASKKDLAKVIASAG